jgi:hypothetical protein
MEKENMELYREMEENVAAQEQADAKAAEIFVFFDEVCAKRYSFPFSIMSLSFERKRTPAARDCVVAVHTDDGKLTVCLSCCFTGLCQVEGSPHGGYAGVVGFNRRDSERREAPAMM